MVATTVHAVACVTVSTAPVITHAAGDATYVTAPPVVPPVVVSVMDDDVATERVVLEMRSGA